MNIHYHAGNYGYAVRWVDTGGLTMHHPEEDSMKSEGWEVVWVDRTQKGAFFVFRKPINGGDK